MRSSAYVSHTPRARSLQSQHGMFGSGLVTTASLGKAVKVRLRLLRSGSVRHILVSQGSHGQLRRVKLCSVKAV